MFAPRGNSRGSQKKTNNDNLHATTLLYVFILYLCSDFSFFTVNINKTTVN